MDEEVIGIKIGIKTHRKEILHLLKFLGQFESNYQVHFENFTNLFQFSDLLLQHNIRY